MCLLHLAQWIPNRCQFAIELFCNSRVHLFSKRRFKYWCFSASLLAVFDFFGETYRTESIFHTSLWLDVGLLFYQYLIVSAVAVDISGSSPTPYGPVMSSGLLCLYFLELGHRVFHHVVGKKVVWCSCWCGEQPVLLYLICNKEGSAWNSATHHSDLLLTPSRRGRWRSIQYHAYMKNGEHHLQIQNGVHYSNNFLECMKIFNMTT